MKLKRPLSDKDNCKKKQGIYESVKSLKPLQPQLQEIAGLTSGNKKTGTSGAKFDWIYVWNLPPFVTCPGASEWCCTHCYNLDERTDVYPIDDWRVNLWQFLNEEKKLQEKIETQLYNEKGSCAVRIHSSGDFFSNSYIDFWGRIISGFQHVSFWTYTRSWAVKELESSIRRLSALDNLTLYASYDSSMHKESHGYPRSLVFDTTDELFLYQRTFGGVICPEQFDTIKCCADCGLCIGRPNKDVLFLLH